jgi:hypothetical protein
MRTSIVMLACAALLAGTAAASAHRIHSRHHVVYPRTYGHVVHHGISRPVTVGRSSSYIDDPPGAAFQNRYIRMDNGYPAIR